VTRLASLPMYNFPAMRPANAAFWRALAALLDADGASGVPALLDFGQGPVPDSIPGSTFFTQTCGYPLQTLYRGQYQYLATPSYIAPGCGLMTHCAFLIVRDQDPAQGIEDLRGRRFAVNSPHSNSGMSLPRRLIAPFATDGRFFASVALSGSHPRSLDMVRQGEVDTASVDCLTWAFAAEHAPDLTAGLRVLAETPPSPAIPFVTGLDATPDEIAALRRALAVIGSEPDYARIREGLRLRMIGQVPATAYQSLLDYEAEADAMGYPKIG
jgi:ABC-type phosphate/phosphonate transport system substrate-binding protein